MMGDNELWDCSVCTYRNNSEAFKCQVCDTRKGTSTRKPRVTANIVAQQIASSFPPLPPLPPASKYQRSNSKNNSLVESHLQEQIDRDSGRDMEVTVNGVTVVITDYQVIPKQNAPTPIEVEKGFDENIVSPVNEEKET